MTQYIYYKASDCTNEPPSEVAALQSCGASIEMHILISNPSMNHPHYTEVM